MNRLLRKKFLDNKSAYGMWVTTEATPVVEVAGELGLDWVCIDMEHGYLGYRELSNLLVASRTTRLSVFVRPADHNLEPMKRALDLGASGLIIPMIETADALRAVQRNAYYPPRGRRGIGGEASARWGLRLGDYVRTANDDIMLIPMIETALGCDNFDEIVAVESVEAVFMGPVDMAASYGHTYGENAKIEARILDMADRGAECGVRTGIGAGDAADAVRRTEQGFGMVSLGTDIGLMIRQLQQMRAALLKRDEGLMVEMMRGTESGL